MQRNNNNNNKNTSTKLNNTTPVYKTFCKVCQDSGKLISEYTNHNVRDRSGKTTCPMLLAQECKNCYQRGHTVKYCPLIKADSKTATRETATRETATRETAKPVAKARPVMPKNVFMVFDEEDSEEDEPKQQEEVTEFPALKAGSGSVTNQKPVLNYGKIIDQVNDPATCAKAKEAELLEKVAKYAKEQEMREKAVRCIKERAAKEAELKAIDERIRARASKKFSWADAAIDSEDDDEDDIKEDNSAW